MNTPGVEAYMKGKHAGETDNEFVARMNRTLTKGDWDFILKVKGWHNQLIAKVEAFKGWGKLKIEDLQAVVGMIDRIKDQQ